MSSSFNVGTNFAYKCLNFLLLKKKLYEIAIGGILLYQKMIMFNAILQSKSHNQKLNELNTHTQILFIGLLNHVIIKRFKVLLHCQKHIILYMIQLDNIIALESIRSKLKSIFIVFFSYSCKAIQLLLYRLFSSLNLIYYCK